MQSNVGKSHRYLRIALMLFVLAFIAQTGWQARSGQTTKPTTASGNQTAGAPRPASIAGSSAAAFAGQVDVSAPPCEVGRSVMNDVSLPLRDIKPLAPKPWTSIREMPERESPNGKAAPPVEDPAVQKSFGPNALAMPAPTQNFAGVGNRDGVYPPDTNGDVGPNHFVQWVNLSFQIWNKSGVSLYGPASGNTLWSGFGGPCQTANDGDPVVLYDPIADRWLMSQFTASNPYGECIAISTTPDPTGSYYRYFFQFSTTVFYDYPHLGVWPDGYYMGANRFTSTYQGGAAVVFDRAKMLLGQPANYQSFNTSTTYGTLLPSDLDGSTLPPAGSPDYFASKGSTSLYLFKFHVDWTTPANSTLTGPTSLPVAAYNQLCPTTRGCVSQPSTTVKLDGLGDRLMHRFAYRNFGDHEALVANHGVNVTGSQAGVRWYEIRSPNSSPVIYQQGTYAPDTTSRWLGSAAMDRSGDIALGYSASSTSVFPSIRYTGRLVSDPLGSLPQGEATLIGGSGSQTGTANRWGDYANMTVDPVDDCTFWFTTEYMATTGTASWSTRIGSFKFPSCGGTPPTATNTPVPATATPTTPPTATRTNTPTPPPAASNTPTTPPAATNTPTTPPAPTNTFTPAPPTNTFTPAPATNTATATPATTCGETLANGGFEGGTTPWVQTSTNGYQLIDTTRPHTGTHSAYLGGYNNGTDTIYQQVTIPATATSASLSYWWYMTTQEACCTPYDYMYAQVLNSSGAVLGTLQTLNNASTANTWTKSTFSLLAYKGQTIRIYFKATTDVSLISSFFVDDVSLNVCR